MIWPQLHSRRAQRYVRWIATTLLVVTAVAPTAAAQSSQSRTIDEVMAAFVYQFTRYVEWPADAFENDESPLIICVVGNDDLKKSLTELTRDKDFDGRKIEIVGLPESDEASEDEPAHKCHIAFVADGVESSIGSSETRTLTVGDGQNFTADGGVIRLYQASNKVRIEINIDAAERNELKISSKLLALANIVRDEG